MSAKYNFKVEVGVTKHDDFHEWVSGASFNNFKGAATNFEDAMILHERGVKLINTISKGSDAQGRIYNCSIEIIRETVNGKLVKTKVKTSADLLATKKEKVKLTLRSIFNRKNALIKYKHVTISK